MPTMTISKDKDNDQVTEPLLADNKEQDNLTTPSVLLVTETGKDEEGTKCKGIVRNNRNPEAAIKLTPSSLRSLTKRKRIIIFIVLILALIYVNSSALIWYDHTNDRIQVNHHSHVPGMKEIIATVTAHNTNINVSPTIKPTESINQTLKLINPPPGYLVWSDQCKMPNLDPYAADMMKHFKREKYEPCLTKKPLTRVKYDRTKNQYQLILEESMKDQYTTLAGALDCCYQVIERSGSGKQADRKFTLSACLSFTKTTYLPETTENILVRCKSRKTDTYVNVHAMTPMRPLIRQRLDEWETNDTKRPVSVLMLGIDSISRQNFIRAMPRTAQHLYDTEWFEMSGYNKIDDNTFPNFLAIFAGYNSTTAYGTCAPTKVGALDKCPFIWYDFQKYGYVTAYAEDETSISTFNYLKVGFEKPPTDYYLRPLLLAAEKNLLIKYKSGLKFCLGFKHSADYVYDYAVEFATVYKDDPYFGLFWTNTFSHNALSDPSSMDDKMLDYVHKFEELGILNDTIVIFFSDHGMRFGPSRRLLAGRYEERLPFFFVWLPPWFKDEHPEFVNALNINKNRLTNPYDAHMMLQHIIEISGRAKNMPQAADCSKCQTLLKPVPHSRSCAEIAIEDHWCTCIPYQSLDKGLPLIKHLVTFTVDYINNYISTYKNGTAAHICAKLQLSKIQFAYKAIQLNAHAPANLASYQFVFETKPGNGVFEATVRYDTITKAIEVTGSISRLNSYAKDSRCISDGGAKKYCFCIKSTKKASLRPPNAG